MAVTNSNIFSETYTILKNFINSNVTDPKRRYKKDWIHPSIPNITDQKFDGYPFIVISIDVSEEEKGFDRDTSNKVFRVLLGVYSPDSTEVDSISDEIMQKFKDTTLTNAITDFQSIELSSSPFDFDVVGGRKIHRRLIGIIGRKRI